MNKYKQLAQRYEDCIYSIREQIAKEKPLYIKGSDTKPRNRIAFENVVLSIVNHTSFAFAVDEVQIKRIMEITNYDGDICTYQILANLKHF